VAASRVGAEAAGTMATVAAEAAMASAVVMTATRLRM
jgi:hypothetical protein